MSDFTLYCFAQSGNAYKVALMLQLSGADWQSEWVDFFNGEHKSAAFLAVNEMGEIPALIDHTANDLALSQSGLILDYLAKKLDKFGGSNEVETREILRWILFDNYKLTSSIAPYRFLTHFKKIDENDAAISFLKGRSISALKLLDTHLFDNEWVACSKPTIADFSICGYLFWKDEINLEWERFPNIKSWLQRIENLPGFVPAYDLMPSQANEA